MKKQSRSSPASDILYISVEEIINIHEKMLEIGGGRSGIRDFALLHSACERPKATFAGQNLYPNIWFQAAALIQSIIKNHSFNDGNKRTGYFSMLRFLNLNKIDIEAEDQEIVKFALSISTENLSIEEIANWLKGHSKRN